MKNLLNDFTKIFMKALFIMVLLTIFSSAVTVNADTSISGKWKEIADLPDEASIKAIQVDLNHVLVLGINKKAFLYDINKNKWRTLTNRTISGGTDIKKLKSGNYLIVGGKTYNSKSDKYLYNSCEVYNPKSNSFKAIASLPDQLTSNVTARISEAGDIYAYGTIDSGNLSGFTVNNEYKYDIKKNIWYQTREMDFCGELNLTNRNGDMLQISYDTVLLFNNTTGDYSVKSSMPADRDAASGVTLSDGKFMVIGGRKTIDLPAEDDSAIYDPDRNIWMKTTQMNEGRCNAGAVTLNNGKVFVAGGAYYVVEHGYYYPQKVDLYDPVTDKWSVGPSHEFYYLKPTMILLENGNIMLIGGAKTIYDDNRLKCEIFTWNNSKDGSKKSFSTLSNSILISQGCTYYISEDATKPISDLKNITPIVKNDITMIPFDFLKSAFGASCTEVSANSYRIKINTKTIKITVGSKTAEVDGKSYNLTAAPTVNKKILYLPLNNFMSFINKRITSFDRLIVISDTSVYMDKLDAYKYITQLYPDFQLGLSKYGKIISNKVLFRAGDIEYRLINILEDNRFNYYINEDLPLEDAFNDNNSYTYQCIIKENKKSGEFKIINQGLGLRYIQSTENGFYYSDKGYLAFMDAKTDVSSFIRSGTPMGATLNTKYYMNIFDWNPTSRISIGNAIFKDGWIYFVWDYHSRDKDHLGYPVRVKYDGSELELLSISIIAKKYDYTELPDMHIIGEYIYYRKLNFNENSYDGYNLMRVAIDGSTQEIVARISNYEFMDDGNIRCIRYWQENEKSMTEFQVYDPIKNKVIKTLTLTDATDITTNTYTLAYTYYVDNQVYITDIMTGKSKKFKPYPISQKQYPDSETDLSITAIDDKYVYFALDITDIKTRANTRKTIKLNRSSGKYETYK